MRGIRVFVAAVSCTWIMTGAGIAAADPAGVEFVLEGPISLDRDEGTASFELLNGNPEKQDLSVTAEGEDGGLLLITDEAKEVDPAERVTFSVELEDPPPEGGLTVPLLAVSTDGSVARSEVTIPPAKAAVVPPSLLQVRGMSWAPSPLAALLGLRTTKFQDLRLTGSELDTSGFVSSASGGLTTAAVTDGLAEVAPSDRSGEYTGQLAVGDKSIEVKATARDFVYWPFRVLLAGLATAWCLERYLAHSRPRKHLSLLLEGLLQRARSVQTKAHDALPGDSEGQRLFAVDCIYLEGPTGPSGYLAVARADIDRHYDEALAEFEREQFGPNGAAVRDLSKNVDAFADHLRNEVGLARTARASGAPAGSQANLDRQISRLLSGVLIHTASQLQERIAVVNTTRERLDSAIALVEFSRAMAERAVAQDRDTEAGLARTLADQIIAGVDLSHADGLDAFRATALKIRDDLDKPPAAEAAETVRAFPAPAPLSQSGYPNVPFARVTSEGDEPVIAATTSETIKADMRRADVHFAIVSGFIVMLTGLTLLYLAKEAFGTWNDYLTVFIWGATAQQGLNLLRRLWPSRTGPLSAS